MLNSRPRVPWRFRAANFIGRTAGISKFFRFEEDELRAEAIRKTGLSDFGDRSFEEGFRVFLESLEHDARLSAIGRFGLRGMVVTLLVNRLYLAESMKRRPSSTPAGRRPPVIILGMPRSGTTLLHRMMATDPQFRTLPFWRLFRPFGPASVEFRRREVERVLALRRKIAPDFDRKHFVRADSPEECILLLNTTFVSHGLWVAAPVYGYLDWLQQSDRRGSYLEYREMLAALQDEVPERPLLLKAPNHSGALSLLIEFFPGIRLLQLHRDPTKVFLSLNSLFYSLHSPVTEHLDVRRMALANLAMFEQEMRQNLEARKAYPGRVLDIEYECLRSNPLETLQSIYLQSVWEWTSRTESGVRKYLEENPQGLHGAHFYSGEDFGMMEGELAERFAFFSGGSGESQS